MKWEKSKWEIAVQKKKNLKIPFVYESQIGNLIYSSQLPA